MKPQKRITKSGAIRWVARYVDPTGKERSKSFDTQREAKAFIQEREREVRQGTWIDPADQQVTVKELVLEWAKMAARDGTRKDREGLADNLGTLTDMPVGLVRGTHLRTWATQLRDGRPWADGQPLKPRTVANRVSQLRGVFARAEADGLIARDPGKALRRFPTGAADVAPAYIPSRQEVKHLVDNTTGWLNVFCHLCAEAGLRAGEACGLRVKDVDFLRRVLHVRVQAGLRSGEVRALKWAGGRRDIPISGELATIISQHLDGREVTPDTPVLCTRTGHYPTSRSTGPEFARLREKGVITKQMHPHSLRHFFASSLIAEGVPLTIVAELMGHADVQTTAKTYAHVLPDSDDVARRGIVTASGFLRDRGACGDGVNVSDAGQ